MKTIRFFIVALLMFSLLFLPTAVAYDYLPSRIIVVDGGLGSMALSWDGKILATEYHWVPGDGIFPEVSDWRLRRIIILLWDVATGELLKTHIHTLDPEISPGGFEINSMAFSPDGTILATGLQVSPKENRHANIKEHGNIYLWDVATGAHIDTLPVGYEYMDGVAFSPDGTTLASWGSTGFTRDGITYRVEGGLHLWDVATREIRHTLISNRYGSSTMAFSPDSPTLAVSEYHGWDKSVVSLWDVATGQRSTTQTLDRDQTVITFSPDSTILAIGSRLKDSGILLWDVATEETRTTLNPPSEILLRDYIDWSSRSLAFSPDGALLAEGTRNALLRAGTAGFPADGNLGDLERATTFPRQLWLWDIGTRRLRYILPVANVLFDGIPVPHKIFGEPDNLDYDQEFIGAAFTSDGNTLVSVGDSAIYLYDTSTRVRITPDSVVSPAIGEQLTVNVSITSQQNIAGYQVTVGFNPTALRYIKSTNEDYLPVGAVVAPSVVSRRNRVTLAAAAPDGGGTGDGTLATLTFEVLALKESRLLFHDAQITGSNGKNLISSTYNGAVTLPASPATVNLTPASVASPAIGEQLTFKANIAGGRNVASYKLAWHYDKTALSYVSESKGDYVLPNGVGNGSGTLATATFKVLAVKTSTVSVSGTLTDPNGTPFTPTFESAEVTVPILGDVNRDGVVNLLDLALVAVSFTQQVSADGNPADVNEDGVVDISDLLIVASAVGTDAAAPTAGDNTGQALQNLTAAEVQQWLTQAQQLGFTDATSQRGIRFLEQLLEALTPKETMLLPNYPNPFNPETWIPYQLAASAEVTLTIYTVDGQRVRQLVIGHQPAGIYRSKQRAAYWDGKNEHGEPVASGVYFYTLTAGEFSATQKMLIRK